VSGLKEEKLIKSKPTWKLKQLYSTSSEYLCHIWSKLIPIILSYCCKVGSFLRHGVYMTIEAQNTISEKTVSDLKQSYVIFSINASQQINIVPTFMNSQFSQGSAATHSRWGGSLRYSKQNVSLGIFRRKNFVNWFTTGKVMTHNFASAHRIESRTSPGKFISLLGNKFPGINNPSYEWQNMKCLVFWDTVCTPYISGRREWVVSYRHISKLGYAVWCHMGTIKHPVPDRVKPSFVIFDIRALWCPTLSVRVPGCQKLQMTA